MKKEILEKIKKIAYQNAFNDKQTKDFIDLVNSGTTGVPPKTLPEKS